MAALSRAKVAGPRRGGLRTLLWTSAVACTLIAPTIAGAAGTQAIVCFGSAATIVGTEGPDELRGTPGNDVVVTLGGIDTFDGTPGGSDKICTGDGGDTVVAGPGNDQVDLGADSDSVLGGRGDDNLLGGEGPDLLAYFTAPVGVQVSLASGTATGDGNDTVSGFEWVAGSARGDVLEGDDGPNIFTPDDLTRLPSGADDVIHGRGGFDFVLFEGRVRGNLATGEVVGDGTDRVTGMEGLFAAAASTLVGDSGPNVLGGGSEPVVLDGAGGDDTLVGGTANDRLSGGAGLDLIAGGGGNDAIDGGAGLGDLVSYLNSPARVQVSLASKRGRGHGVDTLAGLEAIVGSQFGDTLTGSGRADRLQGKDGNDLLSGGGGDDFLDGGGARDRLVGGANADYCFDGERNSGCEASDRSRISAKSAWRPVRRGTSAGLEGMLAALHALAGGKPVHASTLADASASPLGLEAATSADPYAYRRLPACTRRGGQRVTSISPPDQMQLGARRGALTVRWRASLKDAKGSVIFQTAFAQVVLEEGNSGYPAGQWVDLSTNRPYQARGVPLRGASARRWEAEIRIAAIPPSTHPVPPPCPIG